MGKTEFYTATDRFVSSETPDAATWNKRVEDLPQAEFEKRDSLSRGCYTAPTLMIAGASAVNGTVDCLIYGIRVQGAVTWQFGTAQTAGNYTLTIDANGDAQIRSAVAANDLAFATVQWNGTALSDLVVTATVGIQTTGGGSSGTGTITINGKTDNTFTLTTTDIPEGAARLYHTPDRVQAVVDADKAADGKMATIDPATGKVYATQLPGSVTGGDMARSVYDTNDNGIVDKAETLSDGTNIVTAADAKTAVTKAHTQNSDTYTTSSTFGIGGTNRLLSFDNTTNKPCYSTDSGGTWNPIGEGAGGTVSEATHAITADSATVAGSVDWADVKNKPVVASDGEIEWRFQLSSVRVTAADISVSGTAITISGIEGWLAGVKLPSSATWDLTQMTGVPTSTTEPDRLYLCYINTNELVQPLFQTFHVGPIDDISLSHISIASCNVSNGLPSDVQALLPRVYIEGLEPPEYAKTAGEAAHAATATNATHADSATTADNATNATHATAADTADYAATADQALHIYGGTL